MNFAADAPPSQPWWLVIAGIAGTIIVGYLAARAPVWVEKVKARKSSSDTPAEKVAGAEEVLREWLKNALLERDTALAEVKRLGERIDLLERELWRLGWDGRTG